MSFSINFKYIIQNKQTFRFVAVTCWSDGLKICERANDVYKLKKVS